jgi:hypothetical protein
MMHDRLTEIGILSFRMPVPDQTVDVHIIW